LIIILPFENPSLPPFSLRARGQREEILTSPFVSFSCRQTGKRGIEGDFMVILLISLAFEIHFSKG
jgi:hypothetical protein